MRNCEEALKCVLQGKTTLGKPMLTQMSDLPRMTQDLPMITQDSHDAPLCFTKGFHPHCVFLRPILQIFLGWHKIYIGWHKIYLWWHKIYLGWHKIHLGWHKIQPVGHNKDIITGWHRPSKIHAHLKFPFALANVAMKTGYVDGSACQHWRWRMPPLWLLPRCPLWTELRGWANIGSLADSSPFASDNVVRTHTHTQK